MTMGGLQSSYISYSPFGCFRRALTLATFVGDMNAIQLFHWPSVDIYMKRTLASWLWVVLARLGMLGKGFTSLSEGLRCQRVCAGL